MDHRKKIPKSKIALYYYAGTKSQKQNLYMSYHHLDTSAKLMHQMILSTISKSGFRNNIFSKMMKIGLRP